MAESPPVGGGCFCGSIRFEIELPTLFCESDRHPDAIDIALANVDGPIDREPEMHVYFSDRAAWLRVADSLPRLGGASGLEPLEAAGGADLPAHDR